MREADDPRGVAWSLQCLGNVTLLLGDLDAAEAIHTEALAVARDADSPSGVSGALTGLGSLAARQGDHVRAYGLFVDGFELRRAHSDRALTDQLNVLGRAAMGMRDSDLAATHFGESLQMCRAQGIKWDAAFALDGLAEVERQAGEASQAATLFGAADALLDALGARRSAADQDRHDQLLQSLRNALGESAFNQAATSGRAMTRDEAIDCALNGPSIPRR
jgi:hypothetical protein